MLKSSEVTSGREGARIVRVWDPLVRLIHWALALTILLNGAILDEDGKPHEWIGYLAVALIAIRLLWGIVGTRNAGFKAFPPSIGRAKAHMRSILAGKSVVHLSHNPLGALMVYNLWLTVLALGVTGYMMTTTMFFGMEWVEEAHELFFGWLMISVGLHVAGVAFDTWWSGVNLVRAMVDGKKRIPRDASVE